MSNDRMSSLALMAGSAGMIITMGLHPTGHDLFAPGHFAGVAWLTKATHGLALASLPVLFLGVLGLSQRLGWNDRLSIAALIFHGFGTIAAMNAAVASGLVAPAIGRRVVDAGAGGADTWRVAFSVNGMVNQGFAVVLVVASSAAILLWSASILRGEIFGRGTAARRLAVYGCVIGPLAILAVLSGRVRLDVHGFGAIVLGQAIWYAGAAFVLYSGQTLASDTQRPRSERVIDDLGTS
jgi:hypothetical protein